MINGMVNRNGQPYQQQFQSSDTIYMLTAELETACCCIRGIWNRRTIWDWPVRLYIEKIKKMLFETSLDDSVIEVKQERPFVKRKTISVRPKPTYNTVFYQPSRHSIQFAFFVSCTLNSLLSPPQWRRCRAWHVEVRLVDDSLVPTRQPSSEECLA